MSMKLENKSSFLWSAKTVLTTIILTASSYLSAGDLNIVDHTIRWTGETPVKYHTGLLSPKAFSASIAGDGTIESLSVVLDMNSIDVTDLEGRSRDRLTSHLKSEDFFLVSEYPEASFVMQAYKNGKMHGTITIRGIAQQIAIPVKVSGSPASGWNLSGKFAFNRQNFNVNYANSGIIGLAKDKIIDDEIQLEIELLVK